MSDNDINDLTPQNKKTTFYFKHKVQAPAFGLWGIDLSANSKWKCIFPRQSTFQFQHVEIYISLT